MSLADHDVLIAGAGPVGLTLGALLARQRLRCLVVDRAAARTDKSKALVIWPRTLELLQGVGAEQPFLAAGIPAYGGRLFSAGREIGRLDFRHSGSPFAAALMIPQSESERVLEAEARAAGAELARQTELLRFADGGDAVHATLRGADGVERTVSCAWLVGCDGAHSTVRHGLGLAFAGTAENDDWFLADVRIAGDLPRDEVRIHLHPDGILACFPIPPDRFRIVGDLGPARGEHPPEPTLADVQGLLERRGPGSLIAHDPEWLSGFRINERQVPAYRVGRVMLAGDAAHVHSPAGGQGMNTGMHDAFNLAWKLGLTQQGRARPALLESYHAERHPVGAAIVRGAAAATRIATLHNALARHLRDAVIRLVSRLPAAQHAVVGALTETAIRYRRSPLVRDARGAGARRGVRAGDRVPDLALAGGHLYGRLRGDRHVLLLPGDDTGIGAAVAAAFGDLCDVHAIGSEPFGPGVAAVVRPDAHLGYLGPSRAETIVGFLDTYLLRESSAAESGA